MASTSLPALRDRSVGVKRGQNPNIGVEAAVSKHWGEKRTKPKHWGFPDYYPLGKWHCLERELGNNGEMRVNAEEYEQAKEFRTQGLVHGKGETDFLQKETHYQMPASRIPVVPWPAPL